MQQGASVPHPCSREHWALRLAAEVGMKAAGSKRKNKPVKCLSLHFRKDNDYFWKAEGFAD